MTDAILPGYAPSLTTYSRRLTRVVTIGEVPLGGHHPIRVQSMTTADTMDTAATVAECIALIEAGCEYVRITAPSLKEAANLEHIKKELRVRGYNTPLVADIHFTPNAAELAARLVEKVRINPGNYADRKRFEHIDYTEASYAAELDRIRERFVPLVKLCKEYGTAMRIGTNHGSLSDRILSRYGDTPHGMVESALEFIRICEDEGYYNLVVSMKSSNPQVMVQAYRLLVDRLQTEGLQPYPLHLGVTEAGDGEDGRIKSAAGIGTLLEDGLGDTIRVSLTEDPVLEIPVARALAERYTQRAEAITNHGRDVAAYGTYPIDPYHYHRRNTHAVLNLGATQVPRVIADLSALTHVEMADLRHVGHHYLPEPDKWVLTDLGADYLYTGSNPLGFMVANGSREIRDYQAWQVADDQRHVYPMLTATQYLTGAPARSEINFVSAEDIEVNDALIARLSADATAVLVLHTLNPHAMPALRRAIATLLENGCHTPVVIRLLPTHTDADRLPLYAATDAGGLLIDGLGDSLMLSTRALPATGKDEHLTLLGQLNSIAFNILQAARTRMSKTEYISCPSCGRTLFDLQETTAMIRKRTDHLKGVKIGIMGCIVNGPGEMADADYGYVGVGKGKISLYRGQEVVKKFVPAENAVDELIELIREDGRWSEPATLEQLAGV